MKRNMKGKPNGTEAEYEWNKTREQIRMERTARPNEMETNHTAREREREREKSAGERKYSQFINRLSRALPNVRAHSGYIQVPRTFAFHSRPSSQHPMFPYPPLLCSMLHFGFVISHGGMATQCTTLRGGAGSLYAMLHGGAASLCATLRSGVVSLCSILCGGVVSLYARLRGGAAWLFAMLRRSELSLCALLHGGVASLDAALSLGRRGTIPSASHHGDIVPLSGAALFKCIMPLSSHDERAVPSSHDWGAVPSSVSCGSARVWVLYAQAAEVVVLVGVAVGAVAGVVRSTGWGLRRGSSCGSSCGVKSCLAPRAES